MNDEQKSIGKVSDDKLLEKVTTVAPDLVEMTKRVVFGEVWERPVLAKRDRSIVTLSILIARGGLEELPGHFRRARDNGLTDAEISEIVTHSAYYAGWASAMTAARVLHDTLGFDLRSDAKSAENLR